MRQMSCLIPQFNPYVLVLPTTFSILVYFDTMSKILSVIIKISPHLAIFRLPEDHNWFTSTELDILAFTSLLARHRLLHWKSTKAPSSAQWLNNTMSFLKLEKIRYSVKGSSNKFYNKWLPFLTFFHSLQALPPDWRTPPPLSFFFLFIY